MKRSKQTAPKRRRELAGVQKTPTGIEGLDSITGGGFPTGRATLLCGSETDARDLLKNVLEHSGASVTTAANARSALDLARQAPPDVIVSDIGMPDEDGYSFIRKLRSLPTEQGGRTPALALTAYARAEDRTRALLEGFQNHSVKPIEPQELLAAVASLAGRYS